MVLVTGEGGSTSECLLAIGVRALVRTLSRVCPAVAGERAAVTERLIWVSALVTNIRYLFSGTYLGAGLAMMRLLACVNSLMDSQGRSLDELFSTAGPVANVRSNTTVDALCKLLAMVRKTLSWSLTVASEIAASRETLSASAARVRLDGLLRRRRLVLLLLRHVLHMHVRHAAHVGHLGVAGDTHGGGHGVWDMHRRLHRRRRWVGSCDTVRVGVLRVLGAVRRGGSLHAGFVLNEGVLVLVVIEETGSKLHLTFLIEHVGDVHNLRRSW